MLISKTADVIWNSRNKKHYVDKGYEFTGMGSVFSVNVEHLTKGSQAFVDLKCDYCGTTYKIQWYSYMYIHNKNLVNTDACAKCCETKCMDSIKLKYGSYSKMYDASNNKRKNTNINRYGSPNVFGSEIIKNKIVETNINRYGVPYTQQSADVRNKTINTCIERYGVKNYIEVYKGKFIGENSPVWKGGVEHSRVERATHEYTTWRNSVFTRDKYTCVVCGARTSLGCQVELHAHHIKNWADNIDDRYDVNNGVTMCDCCHYKFHSIYGKRNNTLEQFKNFISNIELDEKIC